MLSRRLLRIKAVKALYAHFKSDSDSLISSEKNLMFSIDKTYELYHQLLWLIVDVATVAENKIELGRKKHLPTEQERNPNTKFIDNRVIAALRNSERLTDYLTSHKLGWVRYPELIKHLYNAMTASDYYLDYMASPSRSFKEDQKLVEDFYTYTVDNCEALENVVEEQSIFWADDVDFAKEPVMPGKEVPFSFEFDSKGFNGYQLKHITISTSIAAQPFTLVAAGEVIPAE